MHLDVGEARGRGPISGKHFGGRCVALIAHIMQIGAFTPSRSSVKSNIRVPWHEIPQS
jgi:hypothetical protein